ncbi:MAG: UDP-N-acetylmuramate dehydrogenase [Pseudomonadales bacterium]|jgi:UDP-N-acetylmuramate dehydrogenase|nr:UDP-N-acetylmuramate dehydrogenase [Pseudomonadales bacterium]
MAEALAEPLALRIQQNVDLHHLNTFRVAARARYFTQITAPEHVPALCAWLREHPMPHLLIGQASNILFRQDYPGLIIDFSLKGVRVETQSAAQVDVAVNGGEIWHDFVCYCLREHWYGLENLSLIPGTVGAAPVQNIGAYGVELSRFVRYVDAVELSSGSARRFSAADCEFGYRSSIFKHALRDRYLITCVGLRLARQSALVLDYPALQEALREVPPDELTPQLLSDTVCAIRRSKLPDPRQLGNAGSFFWNPQITRARFAELRQDYPEIPGYPEDEYVKIPAAWLIERCGWKGYREGDVGVHQEHALVLVNHGKATGAALVALAERIQASVEQRFGIQLVPEVRIV